jgi:5'-deoxynucleotidase YfbR-like HD superfamily hydrolase
MKMIDKLGLRLRATSVERFHTNPVIHTRTVGHHTANMILMADWTYDGDPGYPLIRAILHHDLHELELGDIPYPIKNNLGLKIKLGQIEAKINEKMGIHNESLTVEECRVLSLVDSLEFMFYLTQERFLGNMNNGAEFKIASQAVNSILAKMDGPVASRLQELHQVLLREMGKL